MSGGPRNHTPYIHPHHLWVMEKAFIDRWKNDFPEDRLIFLAKRFANVELLGVSYPREIMAELSWLAKQTPRPHILPNPYGRPGCMAQPKDLQNINIPMQLIPPSNPSNTVYNKTQISNADKDVILINTPLEIISLTDDDSSDETPSVTESCEPAAENSGSCVNNMAEPMAVDPTEINSLPEVPRIYVVRNKLTKNMRKKLNKRLRKFNLDQAKKNKTNRPNATASQNPDQSAAQTITIKTVDLTESETETEKVTLKGPQNLLVAITTDPPTVLTYNHAELLKNVIVEKILLTAHESTYVPAFRGKPVLSEGALRIWCEDEDALHWLRTTVLELPPPKIGRYVLVSQSEILTRVRTGVLLPGKTISDVNLAIKMLSQQNSWKSIHTWKVHSAKMQARGLFLILGIPLADVPRLMHSKGRLAYLMGSVYIRYFWGGQLRNDPPAYVTNLVS